MKSPSLVVAASLIAAMSSTAVARQPTDTPSETKITADTPPPVFSNTPFADALAATKGHATILVVKATATWCAPCHMMDRTTWRDESIVNWFHDHGTAIQLDVDEHADLTRELNIHAMPTMIAFKEGREFDRVVGYQKTGEFLKWLEAVRAGERSGDKLLKKLDQVRNGEKISMQDRYRLAADLAQAEHLDDATDEMVWLWNNMAEIDPAMSGVRVSFFVSDMERLASRFPPAAKRFTALRDQTSDRLPKDDRQLSLRHDWIALNRVIHDEDATLAWFDSIKGTPAAAATLGRIGYTLEDLLESRSRWADLALLYTDPSKKLSELHDLYQMSEKHTLPESMDEAMRAEYRKFSLDNHRKSVATIYAGLLAAGHEDTAAKYVTKALKLDDSAGLRAALVSRALDANQPREAHSQLLDAAKAAGENTDALRQRLDSLTKENQK